MINAAKLTGTHVCLRACLTLTVPVEKKQEKRKSDNFKVLGISGECILASDILNVCLQDLTNLL